MFLFLKLTLD
jgi:5'-3' exonuclease